MIKKTLYFGNPTYLSMRNRQLVVKLPEVEKNDTLPEKLKKDSKVTFPIEDLGVIILDHNQITLTHGLIEMLLENNTALITCNSNRMPVGLMLPLCGNKTQTEKCKPIFSPLLFCNKSCISSSPSVRPKASSR